MSVLEQARSIFGRISRHRPGNTGRMPNRRHCDNSLGNSVSGSLVGRVELGLVSSPASVAKLVTETEAVSVGARFGKYYLEKIANLDKHGENTNCGTGNYRKHELIALQDALPKKRI